MAVTLLYWSPCPLNLEEWLEVRRLLGNVCDRRERTLEVAVGWPAHRMHLLLLSQFFTFHGSFQITTQTSNSHALCRSYKKLKYLWMATTRVQAWQVEILKLAKVSETKAEGLEEESGKKPVPTLTSLEC